jgi:endonuclease-3
MATQSKTQLLNQIHSLLKKRYKPKPEKGAGKMSVLEAVVYGSCHEGTTREQANQALSRYKDEFFNWNEVRVSTIEEVQSALAGLPDAEPRAQRIRRFLRQLFEKTYGFTLEALTKKPLRDSLKALSEYEAFDSDYIQATVVQQALGGHAIPIDAASRRALARLGVVEPDAEPAAIRHMLERAIPKNRGAEFGDLLEELAHDTCVEGEPDCPSCELKKLCPTAHQLKERAQAAAKLAATKAKAAAKENARTAVKENAKVAAKPAVRESVKAAPTISRKPAKPAPKPAKTSKPPAKGRTRTSK